MEGELHAVPTEGESTAAHEHTLPTMGLQFKQNLLWNVNTICPVSAVGTAV